MPKGDASDVCFNQCLLVFLEKCHVCLFLFLRRRKRSILAQMYATHLGIPLLFMSTAHLCLLFLCLLSLLRCSGLTLVVGEVGLVPTSIRCPKGLLCLCISFLSRTYLNSVCVSNTSSVVKQCENDLVVVLVSWLAGTIYQMPCHPEWCPLMNWKLFCTEILYSPIAIESCLEHSNMLVWDLPRISTVDVTQSRTYHCCRCQVSVQSEIWDISLFNVAVRYVSWWPTCSKPPWCTQLKESVKAPLCSSIE